MSAHRPLSLEEVKAEVELIAPELRGSEDSETYRCAVMLLSSIFVTGPSLEALINFTGYSPEFISKVASRMFKSELWERPDIVRADHWFAGNRYRLAAFWCDVLVAEGRLAARLQENGIFRYWLVEFGPAESQLQ